MHLLTRYEAPFKIFLVLIPIKVRVGSFAGTYVLKENQTVS